MKDITIASGACCSRMMRPPRSLLVLSRASLQFFTSLLFIELAAVVAAADRIDYNRDIRPILSENCYACHGPDKDKRKAGLRLDLKEDALRKLASGDVAIVPGRPDQSRLLQVITLPAEDDDHMPPVESGKKLSAAQIELLRQWL